MRTDIQVLRGISVAAVVAFHAVKDYFPKGFLGVDVFFVISGFLITGMILRKLQEGNFVFSDFYLRRAQRLLPASLSTVFFTTIVSVVVLSPTDFADYAKQVIGSLTFTANFFLAQQTGYFSGEAEAKPLLHLWSLSLEEQFYLVAPLLLWITPARGRPWLLFVCMLLSLGLCMMLMTGGSLIGLSQKAISKLVFFMLPTRAWELLVGGVAAWVMMGQPSLYIPRSVKYAALLVILFTCICGVSSTHPGPDALIVTIATVLILLGRDNWLVKNVLTRAIARIGDWSYSLYLVHWPLFSFAFIVFLGSPPYWLISLLTILSIVLGWSQYKFVEQQFLNGVMSKPSIIWPSISCATAVLFVAALAINDKSQAVPYIPPMAGLDEKCDQVSSEYHTFPECRVGVEPTAVLWGDSYAMQLVPGIQTVMGSRFAFIQATKNACAPVLNLANVGGNYSVEWAEDCVGFNQSLAASLVEMPFVHDVLIASSWVQLFSLDGTVLYDDGRQQLWSQEVVRDKLLDTVRFVQSTGKRPILIGPTAIANYDVGACNIRRLYDRFLVRPGGCDPSKMEVENRIGAVVDMLKEVSSETGAVLLLPSDVMCAEDQCTSVVNGKSIYLDRGHLTQQGSIEVVRWIKLASLLSQRERAVDAGESPEIP